MTHLVEAEGRVLRQQVGRVAAAVVLLGVVGVLVIVGTGLGLAGIYHWAAPILGAAGAYGVIAALSLTVAAVLGVWAYRWLR